MLETANCTHESGVDEWASRSEIWLCENARLQKPRLTRARNANPLILTGHGTNLRVNNGALVIKQGFSHYPQKAEQFRFFKGDLALPSIILLLDGSGSISFDVLNWLGEQGVALARVKWNGDSAIVASGAGYVVDCDKLAWQLAMQSDHAQRVRFACDLIGQKLRNSIIAMESQFAPSAARDRAIAKASVIAEHLASGRYTDMDRIRSLEGECAVAYFRLWSAIEMQWQATSRYPVPDHWRVFTSRSSVLTGRKPKNWKASHPVNAMLNYAYAVKAAQLQIQTVANGYDPHVGIMHHSRPGFPAYVYDLIEPERPKVDAQIITFAYSRAFSGADFVLRTDGVCRLSPALAKMISGLVLQS